MNKRHQAYNEIKKQILFLALRPGERILENDIIEKMQIGRTPVREALLMLENEKLIFCQNKTGYFVRRLSSQEVYDYIEIRRRLEAYAIPLIIDKITPAEIHQLKGNVKETEKAFKNNDERSLIQSESTFHEILYKASKSDVFIDTIFHLSDRFHWLRAIASRNAEGVLRSIDQHNQIIDAITRKHTDDAKRIVESHIANLEESLAVAKNFFLLDA